MGNNLTDINFGQTKRANYTAAQTDTAVIDGVADTVIDVTGLVATLGNKVSVDVPLLVGFGPTSTPTTDGVIMAHPNLAAGSGVVYGNGAGVIGSGNAGDALRITSGVPTGGSLDIVVTYRLRRLS